MKNAIHIIVFALLGFFSTPNSAFAQLYEVSLNDKIEQSTLIVEGRVIESQCYRADDGDLYTANKIELGSILKGGYREKFLTVTTWGGELDGETQTWTHLLTLDKGNYGLFFLEPTSVPSIQAADFPASFDAYSGQQGFLAFVQNEAKAWIAHDPFHTYTNIESDLYQYTARKTGQTATVVNPTAAAARKTGIRYHFTDIVFDGTTIGFKVYVNSLTDDKKLYRSGLQLNYNPDFFGDNLATNGNLSLYGAGISASSTYSLTQSNVTSSKVKIELTPVGSLSGLVTIGTSEQLLAEGKLTIQNIAADPGITYSLAEMQSMSKFYQGGLAQVFDTVVVDGDWRLSIQSCPTIDSISPKSVAAGVNGLSLNGLNGKITIYGSGFGNPVSGYIKPHLSDVLFYDVDLGFFAAGELEYISWSDNKIEVEVPTMNKQGSTASAGACTGRIGIFTTNFLTGDTCTSYSNDKLYVQFGMFNYPWRQTINNWQISLGNFANVDIYGGQRLNLVDADGMGGYTVDIKPIYPADTVKNKAAVDQIIKALNVYRCGYKINVKISSVSPNAIIRRAALPTGTAGTVMMQGTSSDINCTNLSDLDAGVKGFQVRINQQVLDVLTVGSGTYKFNISDTIPADTSTIYYTDFQRTMIHELGHVFQLRHTNNFGDIMATGSISLPYFNNFSRTLSVNDISGIQHLYLLSKVGACGDAGMTDYVCSTKTEEYNISRNSLFIFPNPSTNEIFAKAPSIDNSYKIQIFSSFGRLILDEKVDAINGILNIHLPENTPNGLFWLKAYDGNGNRFVSNRFMIAK